MKINEKINNENGSVLVLVLMVLVLLTFIGMSSLDFSTVETKIAHNDRCYKQNLFRAESAVMEAAELFKITDDGDKMNQLLPERSDTKEGLYNISDFNPELDKWSEDEGGKDPADASTITDGGTPQYIITFVAQVDGREDGVDFKRYEYAIYGRSGMCNTTLDVKSGYIDRF